MIRAIIAQTNEIDEIDLAVVNLLAQLELDQNLLSYSTGLVFAHLEDLEPGLLASLAQALPFPITGISSPMTSSQTNKADFSLLTLAVLTSNDVVFATGLSGPMGEAGGEMSKLVESLSRGQNQRPRLGLLFGCSNTDTIRADRIVKEFSQAVPGCPAFGSLAGDYITTAVPPRLIYGGETYDDRYSLILMYGLIRPKFNMIPIPEKRSLKHRAIISRSDGYRVDEVNGMPVSEYLNKLGFMQELRELTMQVPFFVTNPGGETRMMMLAGLDPDGRAIMSQDVIPNSTIGLAGFDETDVMRTARRLTEELKWEQFDCCLIMTCLGRNLMLGLNYLAELNQFKGDLGDLLPYVACCSGGEICPVLDDEGETVNQFHNLVLASCRF
jgi:hypothetical protein